MQLQEIKNVVSLIMGKSASLFNSLTHTLCLLENKSLKNIGLICIAEKLYIKYREMKVEFFTMGDAIWIGGKDQQRLTAQYKYVPNWEEFNLF